MISGLSHWQKLGLLDESYLTRFGITVPDLSLPFSIDLEELVKTDFADLILLTQKISYHPVLSSRLYPLLLTFGSRIKGYAGLKTDLDFAIFFRPNTQLKDRQETLDLLNQLSPQRGNMDALEFWLEDKDGKLHFKSSYNNIGNMVGESQVHFLLGGVWVNTTSEFDQLYQLILAQYLDLSRFGDDKEEQRSKLLGQMELDVLQFRLMHKGYKRFYPNKKTTEALYDQAIDWESDFWDPGYRRVASQLFVSRVFLPDLS